MKTDISAHNFYIKRFITVIKNQTPAPRAPTKPIWSGNRHSDAFAYILTGSCTYRFDDGLEFTVHEGDVLYLAQNAVYTMHVHEGGYSFIYCDFEFDTDAPRTSAVYSPKMEYRAEKYFTKLLNRYASSSHSAFCECMSLLYDIYSVIQISAVREYIAQNARSKIADAKAYIDANYSNTDLSISYLAEYIGMSEVYLRKLFKSQYDISPSQYILSVRLKKARALMKYPFLSLEACALQSGFSSVQYFCRVFKKETGMTPHRYRKQL